MIDPGRIVFKRWPEDDADSLRLSAQEGRDFQLIVIEAACRGLAAAMGVQLSLSRAISLRRRWTFGEFRMGRRHAGRCRALCRGLGLQLRGSLPGSLSRCARRGCGHPAGMSGMLLT